MHPVKQYQPKSAVPEDWTFSIKWTFESTTGGTYISDYSGDLILKTNHSDEYPKKIGFIKCVKVHRANIGNDGQDVVEVCDNESQELYEVALATENDAKGEDNDEIRQGDLVYVQEIEIDHAFRGIGLGLYMLNEAHHTVNSEMSMTILKPFPLQHQTHVWTPFCAETDSALTLRRADDGVMPFYSDEKNIDRRNARALQAGDPAAPEVTPAELAEDARVEQDRRAATKKLQKYYGLMGFRPFKKYYLAHWNGYVSPRLRAVCPHLFK